MFLVSVLDLIGGGSRSTTPVSLISRKSPTMDQGVQAGAPKDDKKNMQKPIQPPGQRNNQRERQDSRGDRQDQQRNHKQGQHSGQQIHNQQQGNRGSWGRGNVRQRGNRGRGGGMFRPPQGPPNAASGSKPKSTLKFENDYDFEQANTEFEELRSQLNKVKITEEPTKVVEVNGDSEKKDDSGNETGAGEAEQEEDQEVYYDKSKSFFDNISCEAVERSKGRSQRTDWRTERKLNSETFGVSATRRGGLVFYIIFFFFL